MNILLFLTLSVIFAFTTAKCLQLYKADIEQNGNYLFWMLASFACWSKVIEHLINSIIELFQ